MSDFAICVLAIIAMFTVAEICRVLRKKRCVDCKRKFKEVKQDVTIGRL